MHAQKADIEFTVTKFYNIEADERKSAIGNSEEANNKAKKINLYLNIHICFTVNYSIWINYIFYPFNFLQGN